MAQNTSSVTVDPIGYLSLAGLLAGLLAGGSIKGGGAQVGARIPLGAGAPAPVELGVTPIINMAIPSNLPVTAGVTLGGTTLALRPADNTTYKLRGRTFTADDVWKDVTRYEMGHIPGYAHFGVQYPAYAFAYPEKYDPMGPTSRNLTQSRAVDMRSLPALHYALKIMLGGK